MSALRVGALVAVLVAGALWSIGRSLRRAPRSIAAAREQMFATAHGASGSSEVVVGAGSAVRRAARRVPLGGGAERWVVRRFGAGLEVVGMTAADVLTRALVGATTVGLAVLAGSVTLIAAGLLPVSPVWLVGAAAAAVIAGWTMVMDVGSRIARRRRELRQAANDFVQLVAVGLTTDQSVEEAIRFALDVSGGPAAELLQAAVSAAPQRGVPVWEALDAIGATYDVRELCEFAASVERQGMQGVSIGTTVSTLAASMRAKALDQLERDADRANANLAGPTIGFVVTTVVFLAYPLALRISEAFGG